MIALQIPILRLQPGIPCDTNGISNAAMASPIYKALNGL